MPTNPLDSILDRELSKAEAKEIIEIASPLLQELVNFSTNVLARCSTSKALSRREDEDVAVLALYRYMIEVTDGIEVLISQSISTASIPLLRSSFETLLSIEYILENDQGYVQRSLAWVTGYAHARLEMYERLDPSTNKGLEAKKLFGSDQIAANIQFPPIADIQRAIANLQIFLTKPHIQQVEQEYKKTKKRPNWYSLFNGPNDLRMLANHLRRGGMYEVLYRTWSTTTHAQDFLPFMDKTIDGKPAIGRLRAPAQVREIASFTSTFMLEATRRMLKKFRAGEEDSLRKWYLSEIRERHRRVAGRDDI